MKNERLAEYMRRNLRQCQLKQLTILESIDRVCRKHDIAYWLDGGTLLGAVRHGGFIPWDDDIDIAMRQEDLDRFVAVAQDELPDNLFLQTPVTDPQAKEPIVKVRDLNSLYIESSDTFNVDYAKGLYVDIFPFINYPTVSKGFARRVCRGISVSNSILHAQHYYSLRSLAEGIYFSVKLACLKAVWAVASLLRPHDTYMSNILINNGYGIMHRQDSVFPLGSIEFEGRTFPAPHNVDAYLSDLYKKYMDIPPVEKRHIHAIFVMPELISGQKDTPSAQG